jgi:hypothetical protein
MDNSINPKNLVKKVDNLFGGSPVILFLGAGHKIQQYPELLSKPWSCIVTSSQDASLSMLFVKNNPRDIYSISNIKEKIEFNRKRLPIIYLNGITEKSDNIEEYDERIMREETRDALLAEFARAANYTFSTILFTEYDKDIKYEISPDVLYKSFKNINHQALLLFNVNEDITAFKKLNSKEIAVTYPYNIGELFNKYGSEYTVDFDEDLAFSTEISRNAYFYINGKAETIVESAIRGFLPYGQLLNISSMESGKVSYNLITEWFYKFLKESFSEPQWYGYDPRWRFNFARDFENDLFEKINKDIEKGQEKPIVLCGQTCSGKSIVLASLAWKIFYEKKIPIIYIQKKDLPVSVKSEWIMALDILINALNAREADKIMVIWDASFYNLTREDHLFQLQTIFKNRGKNLIFIASAMKQQRDVETEKELNKKYYIQKVSVELSEKEKKSLKDLLIDKGKILRDSLEKWFIKNEQEENLLALLYRFIFQIHPELELSLRDEIRASIDDTIKSLEEIPSSELILYEPNAIALQLQKLGLVPKHDINIDWGKKLHFFYRMLAVCSQFKFNVPITFVVEYFKIDNADFRRIIFNAPALRFYEDTEYYSGEYTVSFRTSVEASIYLTRVSSQEQFEIIAYLIKMISKDSYLNDVDFIVKVLRAVGPNSDFEIIPNSYEYYEIIISALEELREKEVFQLGLVIQEVVYIREYYGPANQRAVTFNIETRIDKLTKAVRLSESGLDKMKKGLHIKNMEYSLSVEYIFGWLALREICKNDVKLIKLPFDLSFEDAYDLIKDAIFDYPNNSYAYVALIRLFISKINDAIPYDNKRKLYSYSGLVLDLIDDVDTDFPEIAQNESFIFARNKFYEKLDGLFDSHNADKYCNELLETGSPLGLYLKVSNLLRKHEIKFNIKTDRDHLDICRKAIDILEDNKYRNISIKHPGCIYLLLRLKYYYYNKAPLISYPDERQRTYLNENQWEEIYKWASYFSENILTVNPKLKYKNKVFYTLALAAAHMKRYDLADEAFNKIKEENFFTPIRAKTWHLLCDEYGKLREFKGRIMEKYISEKGSGYLQIDGFKKGVYYSNKWYLNATPSQTVFDNLCIGMSFIGFVAYSKNHSIITGKR